MNWFKISDPENAAVLTWFVTAITTAQINMVVGICTSIIGLGIQLYFKIQKERRDREREMREIEQHEWDKAQKRKRLF